MVIGHGSMFMSMWSKVYVVGMGMGLVSEATAVEVGIQTREEGEARVPPTGLGPELDTNKLPGLIIVWSPAALGIITGSDVWFLSNRYF